MTCWASSSLLLSLTLRTEKFKHLAHDEEKRYNNQYWYGTTKKKRLYHVSGMSLLKNFYASDGERILTLECVSLSCDRLRPLQELGMQRPWPHLLRSPLSCPWVFGTAPTMRTRVTSRLSENCGGGANTSSGPPLPLLKPPRNSGGGGTTNSPSASPSPSSGGGSCAKDTAFLVKGPPESAVLCRPGGRVIKEPGFFKSVPCTRFSSGAEPPDPSDDLPSSKPLGGPTGTSWSELTPLEELSPSSPVLEFRTKKSFG